LLLVDGEENVVAALRRLLRAECGLAPMQVGAGCEIYPSPA